MNKKQRNEKIKQAKDFYAKYKFAKQQAREFRYKIVKLCDEVCHIHYGGRDKAHLADIKAGKIYTLKQFALDVGVNPMTLQKWSEEYRNIVKPLEEEGLISTEKMTKDTAIIIRNMARPIHNRIRRDTPKEKVIERFREVCNSSKEDRLLERYVLAANSVFNFVNEHRLDKLNQEQVGYLRNVITKLHDKLKPENLDLNAKPVVKNTKRRYDNAGF